MLASMPAGLWREWAEFFAAEPFGGVAEDLRAGMLLSLVANMLGGGGKTYQPADWFRSLRETRRDDREQSVERMIEIARMWGSVSGNNR
jgi:hypothetical protein